MDLRSQRIKDIPESATIAMAAKARELKQNGADVISLSLGEPDFKTPEYIVEGAIDEMRTGKYFSYPPVNGYQDLREAISEKFRKENNLEYGPDQIVVSNGAKQSIANVFFALLNPGDEVIIFTPFWVSYTAMVELAGGKPVFIKGGIENDFKASAKQLKEAITDKTKAIIFSSPCNPTGSVFTHDELQDIARAIEDRPEIIMISDEIYELINFTGSHVSIGTFPGMLERTVTVNGFSKGFAMTGWRVGYIGAPQWLAKAANKMQGQYTSGNSSISQRAALVALTQSSGSIQQMANAYRERRDLVRSLLEELPGWEVNMPTGAFYFFPNVTDNFGRKNIKDANDLCMYLLQDAEVSLVTGEAFGAPECIRLSYAASKDELEEAIKRLKKSLEKLY